MPFRVETVSSNSSIIQFCSILFPCYSLVTKVGYEAGNVNIPLTDTRPIAVLLILFTALGGGGTTMNRSSTNTP